MLQCYPLTRISHAAHPASPRPSIDTADTILQNIFSNICLNIFLLARRVRTKFDTLTLNGFPGRKMAKFIVNDTLKAAPALPVSLGITPSEESANERAASVSVTNQKPRITDTRGPQCSRQLIL